MIKRRITIYGIFCGDICYYIGQTADPHNRWLSHRCKSGIAHYLKCAAFVPIATVFTSHDARTVERDLIAEYRNLGQCSLNKGDGSVVIRHGDNRVNQYTQPRLDCDVAEMVKESAARNSRSIPAEVNFVLRQYYISLGLREAIA